MQDARTGNDGVARFAIKTYTNREMESMNQVISHTFCMLWIMREVFGRMSDVVLNCDMYGPICTMAFAQSCSSICFFQSPLR